MGKKGTPIAIRRARARELARYIERGKFVKPLHTSAGEPFPQRANLTGQDSEAYANYAALVLSEEPLSQGKAELSTAELGALFSKKIGSPGDQGTGTVCERPLVPEAVSEALGAWESGESFSEFYSRKLKGFLSGITDGETQRLVRDAADEHVRRTVAHAYSVESYQDALNRYVSLKELYRTIPGEIHDSEGPYSKLAPEIALGFALMDISDYSRNPLGKDGSLFERAKSLPADFVKDAGTLGKMARKLHGLSPHHAFSRQSKLNASGRLVAIYLWACDVYSRIGEDTPYKEGAPDAQKSFRGNSYERKVFNIFCRELSKLPKPRIHNSGEPLEKLLSLEQSHSLPEKQTLENPLEMRPARYARLVSSAKNCLERLSCENYFMPACLS